MIETATAQPNHSGRAPNDQRAEARSPPPPDSEMLRATRLIGLASRTKLSTGIVGLKVRPDAREALTALYTQTLEGLKVIPEEHGYRRWLEPTYEYRLKVVGNMSLDLVGIEDEIANGQVEELIQAAEDELRNLEMITEVMKDWDGVRHDLD